MPTIIEEIDSRIRAALQKFTVASSGYFAGAAHASSHASAGADPVPIATLSGIVTSLGSPGSDSNVATEKAVRSAITASSGSSGALVQVVNTQTGAMATGTTQIPLDDTIPQNSEGDEYMTLSVTPTDAGNMLTIDVVFIGSSDAVDRWLIVALFQDSTANAIAIATVVEYVQQATGMHTLSFTHSMTAGTTSSTTFKVRAGANNTGTTTFNGRGGVRQFGGTIPSSITIAEVVP